MIFQRPVSMQCNCGSVAMVNLDYVDWAIDGDRAMCADLWPF